MPERDQILDVLAGHVGDGDAVDWDGSMQGANEYERRWIANLRILSEVGRVARSGDVSPVHPLPSIDLTVVTAPGGAPGAAPQMPAVWGPLQPLERLGGGGFGDVYRAWDTRLHRQVALKLLRQDSGIASGAMQRAIDEARLLARAEHPHIVRIYGVDTHDGCTGIWMELVQGVSLHDLVTEQGPLPPTEAVRIGIDLCGALSAVHAANVVHQDVKPQNVMSEAGTDRVLLMDFGAGRWRHAADGSQTVTGTPRFTAPEVFAGAVPSPQSDVYSLGALLFFLLTGEAPVTGTTLEEIRRRHASGDVRRLAKMRPELHPMLVAAIDTALDGDRAQRFASAAGFRAALEAVRREQEAVPPVLAAVKYPDDAKDAVSASTSAPAPAPRLVPGPATRRFVVPLAIALAATVAVAAGLFATRAQWLPAAGITANVQYLEATTGRALHLDDAITSADRLQIVIEPSRPAYVYVLNVDPASQSVVMFPMAGGGTPNPLAGGRLHALPGMNGEARLGWTFGGGAGSERFLVVASAERLAEFEDALASLPTVALGGGLTAQPVGEETVALLTRGVTGVAQLSQQPAPQTGAQSLFDLAHELARDPKAKSRVWIQEMRLVNTGR